VIKPLLQGDAFLADVAGTDPGDGFALWWLGQSGFLIKHAGRHLLFDPYLSDSLTEKYAQTDKPHVRMTELVVDPSRLDFIDVVTSSHNHTDHLDGPTLKALRAANPDLTLIVPGANRAFAAERLGCDPAELTVLSDGQSIEVAGFEIHGVPAAHETVERDEAGRSRFMGFVARFGAHAVYHSGDTMLFDGMVDALRPFQVDVALLPINGRRPERRVAGNLWGHEAAQLGRDIGASVVIPCHYEMFEFNTESPEAFVSACVSLGQGYRVLRAGERFDSASIPARAGG